MRERGVFTGGRDGGGLLDDSAASLWELVFLASLHEFDFVIRQAVDFIDEAINLLMVALLDMRGL